MVRRDIMTFRAFLVSTVIAAALAAQTYAEPTVDTRGAQDWGVMQDGHGIYVPSPHIEVGFDGLMPVRTPSQCAAALVSDGNDALRYRIQMIRSARHTIDVQAFTMHGDEAGTLIAEELIAATKRGVRVRVIIDGASNLGMKTKWMLFHMRNHGITVLGYEVSLVQVAAELANPDPVLVHKNLGRRMGPLRKLWYWTKAAFTNLTGLGYANNRYHDKLIVVDAGTENAQAGTGGMNMGNPYFRIGSKPRELWTDEDYMLRGEIVNDYAAVFQRNFDYLMAVKESRPDIFNTERWWAATNWLMEKGTQALNWTLNTRVSNWFLNTPAVQWATNTRAFHWLLQDFAGAKSGEDISRGIDRFTDRLRVASYLREGTREVQAQFVANTAHEFKPKFVPAFGRAVPNRPRLGETYIHTTYADLIRNAREEVLIANAYFAPSEIDEVYEELIAAAARGVRVRIITNSLRTHDVRPLAALSRSHYLRLLEAGAEVYEWGTDPAEGTNHSKYSIIDRQIIFGGTYNLDDRSRWLNGEVNLALMSTVLAEGRADRFYDVDIPRADRVTFDQAREWADPSTWLGRLELRFSRRIRRQL